MEDLMAKFQDLPENAQYVIIVAGALLGLMIIFLLIAIILSVTKKGDGAGSEKGVKVPKRLPIAPLPILSDRENALHRVLVSAMAEFPDYELFAKVSTMAMLGPREQEYPKVAKAIIKKMVNDYHDFVIVDRSRYPRVVIELDSKDTDARENQATRAGLPIIRVRDPRVSSKDMVTRLKKILT